MKRISLLRGIICGALLLSLPVLCCSSVWAQNPNGDPSLRDSDGDGIPDSIDNCPDKPNPGQADGDGNGIGDECETNFINPNPVSISFPENEGAGSRIYERIDGCFALDTEILMADKSTKKIEDIRSGDMIWNPLQKSGQRVKKVVMGPEPIPLYAVTIGAHEVHVTKSHPFLSATGIVTAEQLKLGTAIEEPTGSFAKVTTIKKLPVTPGQKVMNFELEADSANKEFHAIVANEILTGDLFLQSGLDHKQ